MKKLIFVLSLLTFNFSLFTSVLAESSTDSASPVPDELVQENIKKRIEKVVEEKATASGEILAQKTLLKRAWVGDVTNIANQTLTLKNRLGSRQVAFTPQTDFVETPGNKAIKSQDLSLDSRIIAMGFVNGTGVLSAQRIVVVTDFKPTPNREVQLTTLTEDKPAGLTGKTRITTGSDQKPATAKDLIPGAQALLITVAGALVRLHLL